MQQFPYVPLTVWVRNSLVPGLPTLPNTLPVSREVFNTLRALEATAYSLHFDSLNPAFDRYGEVTREARIAVEQFRTNRASFIANSIARENAQRDLEDAAEKIRDLYVRHRFMEELARDSRGKPEIGIPVDGEAADQKWPAYGVVSADAGGTPQVSLTDGTVAFQAKIELKTRNIRPHTLHFERRELQSVSARQDPSTVILTGSPCYIVGWTLSCRTEQSGTKTFSVKSGGILENNLTIEVKAPIFRQAVWRCRIYFVDRKDYKFFT